MGRFEAARWHAVKARALRRIAATKQGRERRRLQATARTHEGMVRIYASVIVIEACDARMQEAQARKGTA